MTITNIKFHDRYSASIYGNGILTSRTLEIEKVTLSQILDEIYDNIAEIEDSDHAESIAYYIKNEILTAFSKGYAWRVTQKDGACGCETLGYFAKYSEARSCCESVSA